MTSPSALLSPASAPLAPYCSGGYAILRDLKEAGWLTDGELRYLDVQIGMIPRKLWFDGRPVSTADVTVIAESLDDRSPVSINRYERRLEQLGLIERITRGDGRRCVIHDGRLGETIAYGVSFAPMVRRAEEIRQAAQARRSELFERRVARGELSSIRGRIRRALPYAATGKQADAEAAIEELLPRRLPKGAPLEQIKAWINAAAHIFAELTGAVLEADEGGGSSTENENMNGASNIFDRPPIHTNHLLPSEDVSQQGIKKAPPHRGSPFFSGAIAHKGCLEKKGRAFGQLKRKNEAPPPADPQHGAKSIDINTALALATPDFAYAYETSNASGWAGIIEAAAQIHPLIGVSKDAWAEACATLGRQAAALAILIIDANHRKPPGHPYAVRKPAGALRGMISKARAGALRLDRVLFGGLQGGAFEEKRSLYICDRRQ